MSPHDSTQKRIQKVRRELSEGKITPVDAQKKIASLEALGPRYVARWTQADGKERTKVCKSRREAERLEREMVVRVSTGDYMDTHLLRTKVSAILDFYADTLRGHASFSSAKAQLERTKADRIGQATLQQLDAQPEQILGDYMDRLRRQMPDAAYATIWNNIVYFRAAVRRFIQKKRLRVVDPFQVLDLPSPDNRRMRAPTFEEFRTIVRVTSHEKYPKWVPLLFTLAWEMGRRPGEYLSLSWPGVHPATEQDLPWVHILTEKQKRGRKEVWDDIPISEAASAALEAYRTECLLAGGAEGKVFPLKRAMHDRYVRQAMDEAGFPDLWLHDFRRAWKNRHQHLPASIRQELQGHGEEMDARYLTDKRKALESAFRGSL